MGNTILVSFRSVFVVPVGLWAMSWHRPHVHGLGVGFSQAIAAMGDRAEHDRTVGDRPSGGIVLKQADRLADQCFADVDRFALPSDLAVMAHPSHVVLAVF